MRNLRLGSTLIIGAAACMMPTGAFAQEQPSYQFDLQAQDLGDALRSVAATAGWELYASADDVNGITASRLRGTFTAKEAIEKLLQGTRLVARFDNDAVIIRERPSAIAAEAQSADEAIVVTGTRIEGVPPAAPVIRISNEDIRNAGQSDLGEVARSLPQNFGGGQNPGIGNGQGPSIDNMNVNGASTFNLRGVGPNATLTLLNGNRFAYTGINSVIDVSAIPVAAVERIEIVADGASAIYGADAVAGVVNILLRRDYEGGSASARVGASTDGGNVQQQYGLAGGTAWSSGHIMAAYDYSRSTEIRAGSRSYTTSANPDTTLFPAMRRHSLLLSGEQALGEAVTFGADFLFKRGCMASATGFAANLPITTSGTIARSHSKSFGLAPTLRVELGGEWKFKASGFIGTDSTDGATQFFFGGSEIPVPPRRFFNRNLAIDAGFQGPLIALSAGDVRLAFGAGARRNHFRSTVSGQSIARRRDNLFAYGEIHVPLTAPAQDMDGLYRLSLTGALRFEDYSDGESVVTPKLGAIWEPIDILRFGVSWGRSFKMPTLYQQYMGYSAVLVPTAGYGSGYPDGSTLVFALGSDARIGPERSENWTLSAQLKPAPGLKLSASWYHIDYRDRVAPPLVSLAGALDNPLYANLITLGPSAADLAAIIAGAVEGLQNGTSEPYDPARVVAIIDGRDRNIARQFFSGVDLALHYRLRLRSGNTLSLSAAATWLGSRQRLLPGAATTDLAGTLFQPPRFRARGGATFGGEPFSVSAFLSHTGGVSDTRRSPIMKHRALTTLDLTGRVQLAKGTELSIAALNIFNSKPDTIFTASAADTPYDTTNYSPTGRFVGLTVRQEW
jgi:outer membrane receptor protein involved in Fe transport